eukprot:TRINITY_DN6399_c0_g1_i7.p1 TRINITY_DN6399_c0_g1~~TRINITY_DN6399_c0_g1_i7.p1  ORF type:complete len:674 (-),score=128.73 TRINITY_DN6399_c0_g1_i7:917-2938(-)
MVGSQALYSTISPPTEPKYHAQFLHEKYFVDPLRAFFSRVGYYVAQNPYKVIAASLAVVLIISGGGLLIESEVRQEYLWGLQGSESWDNFQLRTDLYGSNNRINTIMVVGRKDSGTENLLEQRVFRDLFQIHKDVYSKVSYEGGSKFYPDACQKEYEDGPCIFSNIYLLWNYNEEEILNASQEEIYFRINAFEGILPGILGGVSRDSNGTIIAVKSTLLSYYTDSNRVTESEKFEQSFIDYGLEGRAGYDVAVVAARSWEDEINELLLSDQNLFAGSIILTLIYTSLILGKRSLLLSRFLLGCTSMLAVIFSLGIAFGLSGYSGIKFTILSPMAIFIIVGIGVDGMIIIVDCFSHVDPTYSLPERLSRSLSVAGPTITLIAMTDFTAFMVGMTTNLLSVRNFCFVAGIAVISLWFLQMTLFCAFLILDERRINARRMDCFPCFVVKDADVNQNIEDEQKEQGSVSKFMSNHYAPFLMKPYSKVLVILVFLGMSGASGYLLTTVKIGLPIEDGFSDNSYLRDFYIWNEDYYPGQPSPLDVVVLDVDYTAKTVQEKLLIIPDEILKSEAAVPPPISWFDDFYRWANLTETDIVGDGFYEALPRFLNITQFKKYKRDLVFFEDGRLRASRMNLLIRYRNDPIDRVDDKNDIDDQFKAVGLDGFIYSDWFVYADRDE